MPRRLLILFLLLALPAWAEDNTDLLAPMSPEEASAYNPSAARERMPPPVIVESVPVTSAPLESPRLAGMGTLTGKKGGLDSSLWQETNAGTVIALLRETAATLGRGALPEYTLRELARRTALTHASEPAGNPAPGTEFFAARVMLAAAAGDTEGAAELAKTNPAFIDDENDQRLAVFLLMQAKVVEACANPKLESPSTPFWQKLSVICALGREGGKAQAQLALDLMREGGESDTFFLDLAEQAASGKKKISVKQAPGDMHVLHTALLAVTGLPPAPALLDPLSQMPYPLLLHVKGPEAWRAKIAMALAQSYWATAGTLKNLFASFALNAKTMAALNANAKNLANPKIIPVSLRAAYALRAAAATQNPKTQAALLGLLISLLSPEDLAGALGQAILEALPPPEAGMAASAVPIARLALLQGSGAAKGWYLLAGQDASLAPLAALRGLLEENVWANTLALYAKEQSVPLERRAGALGLLDALGFPPGEKAAATLVALGARLPAAADDAPLRNAVEKKAEGEALLRVFMLSPPDAVSVLLLRIKALRALGFEREAVELVLAKL